MARTRVACTSCSLPFYTDNGVCPYCGQVAPDGGTAELSLRARVTCDTCGLAYYEDENDACPYCARADQARRTAASEAESATDADTADHEAATATDATTPTAEPTSEPTAEDTTTADGDTREPDEDTKDADERPQSLLGALLRPLRKLFGG